MMHLTLKSALVVVCIATLIITFNVAVRWKTPEPQELTISVSGIRGREVTARINVDGTERSVNDTIPAEFTVNAHEVSWEVERLDGPDNELFKVSVHTPSQKNRGGFAESDRTIRGGLIGPSGLRRHRVWHGRRHE